jgi:hypothetical protein
MHLDRLSDELLSGTYGKQQEESQKKKQQTKLNIEIDNTDDEQKKDR